MSRHEVPVFRITEILPHSNADTLGLVQVYGWTCCIKLDNFKVGNLAVYVPPDYVVNLSRHEFSFLFDGKKTTERIKVKKFRGMVSQGLVVALDPTLGLKEGDNAMEALGIVRYEPPEPFSTGGDNVGAPSGLYAPKYDVENFNRYPDLFVSGENVVATEKYHGTNSRFVFASNENCMFCGSRTNWKKEDDKSLWWKALEQNPWIEEWCTKHPNMFLYGEVFGANVQNLTYGAKPNKLFFAAFDILDCNHWVDYEEAIKLIQEVSDSQWVTLVFQGPFDRNFLLDEAEKDSLWPGAESQKREGIVIRPEKERIHPSVGRVLLKMVSNRYLSS